MSGIMSSATYKIISSCRICMCSKPRRDITELQIPDTKESHVEILLYCLGIKVKEKSTIATKICVKCYRKIIDFYQFKMLAHRSDVRIRSLAFDLPDNAVFLNDIKTEELSESDDNIQSEEHFYEINVNEVKEEFKVEEESEDELLSVIKQIKEERDNNQTLEMPLESMLPHKPVTLRKHCPKPLNDMTETSKPEEKPVKKRRGRPKKLNETPKKKKKYPLSQRVCEECGKVVKNLQTHLRIHLPQAERKMVKCEICDKTYMCVRSKNKHVKRKHLSGKTACEICDKKVHNMKFHMLTTHNPDKLPFKCEECGRRFLTQVKLNDHITVHTKTRPFECEQCGKRFRLKSTLDNHRRQVHEGEKSHLCQFCSKSFFKKHHLQLHLRSHTKEKPYKCDECGRCFSSTGILKNHKTIHSGVRNYKCTLCDMSFARPNYLRAHIMSHMKLKRYPCQYCGVKFHRSDHRKRHEFTAHVKHQKDSFDTSIS